MTAPIIGATKMKNYDDAVGAFNVKLPPEDIEELEAYYKPHAIMGAIKVNPAEGEIPLLKK